MGDFILDVKFEKDCRKVLVFLPHVLMTWHCAVQSWEGAITYVHQIKYQSWTIRSCHITTREKTNPYWIWRLIIFVLKKFKKISEFFSRWEEIYINSNQPETLTIRIPDVLWPLMVLAVDYWFWDIKHCYEFPTVIMTRQLQEISDMDFHHV